MSDLVERQAVLDLLQMKYSGKELYKAIYELPSVENKGEWIPVSERLPEIHNYMQEYIVTVKGNFIRTAFFTETNGKSWWSIDNVVAWQPLPEPYKGGEV